MGLVTMNVLTAILVCLATVNAIPSHFPRGKTVTYKYYADIKAGTTDPVSYASQFALDGLLHVKHDTTDPTLKNAYYVALTDVKYGLRNGPTGVTDRVDILHPVVDAAKIIQDPFLIVYDEGGKFQGVKLMESENTWSKNIKQAIASMIQLDLFSIDVQTPMKPRSFTATENTIHGMCQVLYDVHPKDMVRPEDSKVFVVTKVHEPKNCSHFHQRTFDHVETEPCHVKKQDDMTTATTRYFEVEDQGEDVLIKKLVGMGTITYQPWRAKSEAHFLLTNQSLTLENVAPVSEVPLPSLNLQGAPIIRDITFQKPQGNYAQNAAEDMTHGRHIVKLDVLIPKLKKMLGEAADYLEENHLEMKEPDWKHGQTINRLMYTMSYMDVGSLEQVYSAIQDAKTTRDVTMKNVFLGMVTNVGTTATCHFTRNVIRKQKISDLTAIMMLSKMPMHLKVPSERLLLEMEDLLKWGENISPNVRKASILCFASMIHKTFKHLDKNVENPLLTRYLEHFVQHVKNDPEYEMKMVYLMAIKNVQVGNIHKHLAPIIRGDIVVSEKPHHIRIQAMWAIKKAVVSDVEFVYELLWPILANHRLPSSVRIVAYDVLMSQMPHTALMMNIHWLMVYEKNEHVYNYHHTTLKSLANSVEACLEPTRELARKILRFTKVRHAGVQLSGMYIVDYEDPIYGHGEMLKTSVIRNEVTGMVQAGHVEHFTTIGHKHVEHLGIHWDMEGVEDILKMREDGSVDIISNQNVQNVLNQAAHDMPAKKDIHMDVCVSINGYVVLVNHYDKNTWMKVLDMYKQWGSLLADWKLNWQHIVYENQYEMQVPTDVGMQAVMGSRIPNLMSLKISTAIPKGQVPLTMKFEVDARIWRHGEYYMSVYNPVADVWHSIRRVTAQDIVIPVDMNIIYNPETKSFKIALPRLPTTKLSVAGMLTHIKNYVTVTEDENDMLKKSCATCHHYEVVTKGTAHKTYHHSTVDSKDTGLQYSMSIFDCEKHLTPTKQVKYWMSAFMEGHKNTWGDKIVHTVMAIRQKMMNDWISPDVGTCGQLLKIEPSIVHPTSEIQISFRMNVEDLDHTQTSLHFLSNKQINFHGTMIAKAASTNTSVRTWDINVVLDMSQGHVTNVLKVVIGRVTPGEKNLKICMSYRALYSPVDENMAVTINAPKDETNAKLVITAGYAAADEICVEDDTVISVLVKGEPSDEQKKQVNCDVVHDACTKDKELLVSQGVEGAHVRTWACVQENIINTTPRKCSLDISHKQVPTWVWSKVAIVDDVLRFLWFPNMKYVTAHTAPGNVKVIVEYPMCTENVDISVFTPVHDLGRVYSDLPLGDSVWNLLMSNTFYPTEFLIKQKYGLIKMCTVYPQSLVTADNGTLPFTVPDQWTLLSGDHIDKTYAIFVKSMRGQLAMKMFVGENHKVEITPMGENVAVNVDGTGLETPKKGVVVPQDQPANHAIKLTAQDDEFIIHSHYVPVVVTWHQKSVSVVLDSNYQGQVTGLCGHMDDTHKEKLPKVYTIANF